MNGTRNDKIESSKEGWEKNEKESIQRIKQRHRMEARKRGESEKTQEKRRSTNRKLEKETKKKEGYKSQIWNREIDIYQIECIYEMTKKK